MKDFGFQVFIVCADIKSSINSFKLSGIRAREVMPLLIITLSFVDITTEPEKLCFLIDNT